MDNNEEMEYHLYILAELTYKKEHEKENLDEYELFPLDWYSSDDYKLKNKILEEAIMNNKLISQTEQFQYLIEGVRMDK